MEANLKKEAKRLANLACMKGKSPEFLEKQAQINLHVREFKKNPLFTDQKDQKKSEEKFKNYLITHELENLSDIDTLKSLIFNEILEQKIQNTINSFYAKDQFPSDKLTKQLTEIQNQKLSLKIKLGIDQEDNKKDELNQLETLKKRFEKYINLNRHEFTTCCGSCGKLLLLRRRVKDFKCFEHPWFAGRWYFNYEILKDVKDKKITAEQAAKYLKTSIDYITHCLENWKSIISYIETKKK